ncbi:uncharacterized protein N7511_010234 [Penicillium nucicola]|uniref:uncharacterized protein n=1 Tax=Penicillium nucicola TaxID=1850975 RepID=UPI0025459627|nr:uncharacterized protein N7511_010234 [Penicillium nucicola]KAJ5748538.1 hypothetical protein N7511_010234 [Penicillium nucicola]
MDTINELHTLETNTGEASCGEASINGPSPSDVTTEESSSLAVSTDPSINDICTSATSLGDAFTSTEDTKNITTGDTPINDTEMNKPVANETADIPSENTTPKKKRRGRYEPEPDWSAQMREKVNKSNRRIGQACDRCKAKKMRCTPDHDGCASCITHGLPCKVTDRVTGQTYIRGEAEQMRLRIKALNDQAEELKGKIAVLRQENELLRESQVELKNHINVYKSSLDTFEAGFALGNQEADLMHLL